MGVTPVAAQSPAAQSPAALAAAAADAVVVRLGAGRFAIDLADVVEVGRIPRLTRVPGVPPWVAGVANWRGRVLAVLDLRTLLGAERTPAETMSTSGGRVVVLGTDAASVGLLVDGVDGTIAVTDEALPVPSAVAGSDEGLLSGQLPRDDGPIAVLDLAAVIRLRDSLPRRGRATAD